MERKREREREKELRRITSWPCRKTVAESRGDISRGIVHSRKKKRRMITSCFPRVGAPLRSNNLTQRIDYDDYGSYLRSRDGLVLDS